MITAAIKARVVPLLKGSPGCGKSQIVHQIAAEYNLELIDVRLSQCEPPDLAGFPTIDGKKADYVPMWHFPIEGDTPPEGKAGWLLFLDEATSVPPTIQAAAYKLVLDRMVGSHHLHPKVAVVMAGNLETDNAVVFTMSTALQSRLLHLELIVDHKEWDEWAGPYGIESRITSYLKYRPGNLYNFVPDHSDCTYACPRTWEFADRILKVTPDDSPDLLPLLAGCLGEGMARELLGFCKIYKELITIDQIVAAPKTAPVPRDPAQLFALSGAIAHNMTDSNADGLLAYTARMPGEFQMVCLREAVRRNKSLMKHASMREWISKHGSQLV